MDVSTQTGNGAITINYCKYVQIGGKNKQSTDKWNNDVIDGDDSDESDDVSCNKPGNDRLSKLNGREKELLEQLETCHKQIREELNKVRLERNDILVPQKLSDKGDENIRETDTSSSGADLIEMENKDPEIKIYNDLQEKDESFDYKESNRQVEARHSLESSDKDAIDSNRQDGADGQAENDNRQEGAERQEDADRQREKDGDRQEKEKDADGQKEDDADRQEKEKDGDRQEKEKDADRQEEADADGLDKNAKSDRQGEEDADRQEDSHRQKGKEGNRAITINYCKYVQIGGKNKQSTEKWNNDVIDGDDSDESDDVSCNKPGNDRLSKLNEREKELLEKLETCLKKMGLITEELKKVRFIRNNILAPQNLPDRGDENIREMNTSSAGADLREMENKETESKIDNDLQEKDESFDLKGSDRNTVGEHTLESSDEDELDSTRQDGADRQKEEDADRQTCADRQEDDADRQLDSDNRQNDADRQKEDDADGQEKEKDADGQEKEKDAGNRKEVNSKNIHRPI